MRKSHLHQAQDACHPPIAGHNNSADHPTVFEVVRPGMVPSQRLADPLAVGVATAALFAAYALVVQHRVDVHGVLLTLKTSLRGRGGRRSSYWLCDVCTYHIEHVQQWRKLISNQLNMDFQLAGLGGRDVKCGFSVWWLLFTPLWSCQKCVGEGRLHSEGLEGRRIREDGAQHKGWGCVCMGVCVCSAGQRGRRGGGGGGRMSWNYSYSFIPERKALDSHT